MTTLKIILCSVSSVLLFVSHAKTFQEMTRNMSPEEKAAYTEKIKINRLKKTGGFIRDYRGMKGSVIFLNAQHDVPESEFADIPPRLAEFFRRNIRLSSVGNSISYAQIKDAVASANGTCVIVITSDSDLPTLLIAPESKWALVNVRNLNDSDKRRFSTRVRREIVRAFGFLCGADAPNSGSVLNAVNSIADLDDLVGESFGQDVILTMEKHLDAVGVTAYSDSTYNAACLEGWAPAPSNEYQKAVWDRVHSEKERGPVNGIKIKPPNAKK